MILELMKLMVEEPKSIKVTNAFTGDEVEGRRFQEMIEQEKCPHCSETLSKRNNILACRFCGPIRHYDET